MMIPGMLQQAMAGGAQPKVRCPNCGKDIPFGSKFCPECGYNLSATITCPQCKATLPAGSKFCPNCGYQLTGGAKPPAETAEGAGSGENSAEGAPTGAAPPTGSADTGADKPAESENT
jgi:predicted amidophosphoribosyltransferase